MLVTIGGKSGAGKGTLAKRLCDHLGAEYISIGNIKRELATKMGLTIFEFDELGDKPENKEKFDLQYEEYQKSLDPSKTIVLDSRMGFWCQPEGFNVFLTVEVEEAARRIFAHQRADDASGSYDEVLQVTKERDARHRRVYMELYDVDLFDEQHYDVVLDTTNLTPDEVFARVLSAYEYFQAARSS